MDLTEEVKTITDEKTIENTIEQSNEVIVDTKEKEQKRGKKRSAEKVKTRKTKKLKKANKNVSNKNTDNKKAKKKRTTNVQTKRDIIVEKKSVGRKQINKKRKVESMESMIELESVKNKMIDIEDVKKKIIMPNHNESYDEKGEIDRMNQSKEFILMIKEKYADYAGENKIFDCLKSVHNRLCLQDNIFENKNYENVIEKEIEGRVYMKNIIECIKTIKKMIIIEPDVISEYEEIERKCLKKLAELKVMFNELQFLGKKSGIIPISLVITKDPFPRLVKKGEAKTKKGEENELELEIEIISGSSLSVEVVNKSLVLRNIKKRKKVNINIEYESNLEKNKITFYNMKYEKGSKGEVLRLCVEVEISWKIKGNNTVKTLIIKTNLTNPFVIMTNESQLRLQSLNLLNELSIKGMDSTGWDQIVNEIQVMFLRATRQEISPIKRLLSLKDIKYIRLKWFDNTVNRIITENLPRKIQLFWNWFGQVVHTIRYNKIVLDFWCNEYIWGFISKSDANGLLKEKEKGTFIVRFSESNPGKLAIAVKDEEGEEIKHIIVPEEKKLLHYIKTISTFQNLYTCSTNSSLSHDLMTENIIHKSIILKKFQLLSSTLMHFSGYELLIS
jgi:hypothetical protein